MTSSSSTSVPITVSRTKVEGAFIALAAGDALGWPQEFATRGRGQQQPPTAEFREWKRRSGGRYFSHTEIIHAGEYSDDTQLTLAGARSRIHGGMAWWTHLTGIELPLWTIYERGGGGATKRAADNWLRGVAPWKQQDLSMLRRYFDAGGNGVAMRVLPHAVYCATDDDAINLLRDVVADGVTTHGHPRALVGATAYAYATWWLLRSQNTLGYGELVSTLLDNVAIWGAIPNPSGIKNGWFDSACRVVGDYDKIWQSVVNEMAALLMRISDGLAAGSLADDDQILHDLGAMGSIKGSGTVSAAAAIYLSARYAAQPVHGVLRGAFAVGTDTDTIAAMTGGLLGALAGTDWLPREWFSVQDCDYIRMIASKIATHTPPEENMPGRSIRGTDLGRLLEALSSGSHDELVFGDRHVRVVETQDPLNVNRSTTIRQWRLLTSDGQTIHLSKLSKKSKDDKSPSGELEPQRTRFGSSSVPYEDKEQVKALAMGVKLSVANLTKSITFYEKILGLVPLKRSLKFVTFGALSLVDGGYAIDLSGGSVSMERQVGRNRIEIQVSNLDKLHSQLLIKQVRVTQPIKVMPWGERSLHCLDPDGNVVELVEKSTRNPQSD